MRANKSVCFSIVSETELLPDKFATRYHSANVFGEIEFVEAEEEKKAGLLCILRKYSPGYEESGIKYIDASIGRVTVLRLRITEVTGKARKR